MEVFYSLIFLFYVTVFPDVLSGINSGFWGFDVYIYYHNITEDITKGTLFWYIQRIIVSQCEKDLSVCIFTLHCMAKYCPHCSNENKS